MRKIFLVLLSSFLFSTLQAADVVCSCEAPKDCSDVQISFVPSNPGVYMTIEYAYGNRNLEGFANVLRDTKDDSVIYKLSGFVLKEKDNKYYLPGQDRVCN